MKTLAWIEDDIDVMLYLKKSLEEGGFQIEEYRNFGAAMSAIDQISKSDVLLVDVILTPGQTTIDEEDRESGKLGIRFLEEFRGKFGSAVPAVILSVVAGSKETVTQAKLEELNAVVVPKFSPLVDIVGTVNRAVGATQ